MGTGDLLTRGTIWLALGSCVLGAAGDRLGQRSPPWQSVARWAWTAGCVVYLVHVISAFNFYHDWSHTAAYRETARRTAEIFGVNWGGGLFVNYAFTIAWIADVIWRWKSESYRPSANSSIAEYRPSLQRSPLICFDRVPSGFKGGAVIVDNVAAAYEATRHLIELGHQRIAIITGSLKVSTGFERLEGFRKALQEAHLPLRAEYLREGDYSFGSESGYRLGVELLHLPVPPTAVFACNNRITLGLMRAVSELGVRCPDRVSVVGFDDFDWSTLFSPKLTTVIQPCYEMGHRAVQMLLRRIQSRNTALQDGDETLVVLKAQLCVRESTAAPTAEFVSSAESP